MIGHEFASASKLKGASSVLPNALDLNVIFITLEE